MGNLLIFKRKKPEIYIQSQSEEKDENSVRNEFCKLERCTEMYKFKTVIPACKITMDCTSTTLKLSEKKIANDDVFSELLGLHKTPSVVLTLILSCNVGIKKVPLTLSLFENLHYLELSDNHIYEIPWFIIYLKNLDELNLSKNVINCIPRFMTSLCKLSKLNLAYNPITHIPDQLLSMKQLQKIDVSGCIYLKSPTLEECKDGLVDIMKQLDVRANRKNLFYGWTPEYETNTSLQTQVLSLTECCIKTILDFKVDFMSQINVPPRMKVDLEYKGQEKKTTFSISKCSNCRGYFSTEDLFNSHICKRR